MMMLLLPRKHFRISRRADGAEEEEVQPPPWNVLLRMTARLAGHVVGLLLIPPGGEGPDRRRRRGAGDDDAVGDDRRTDDDDDDDSRIDEDDTTMHGGGTEDALLLPSSSSSTAAAATVEDAVTAAMRSAMRALDVVEARLRSLLDSADVDVVTTAAAEDGMMRNWACRADPPDDDVPSSGPSSSSSSYRLAMVFGSSSSADDHDDDVRRGGGEGASSTRRTIERRLETLVSRVHAAGGVDDSAAGPNVDGAQPYLASLLRTLIRPRDPGAWSRPIDESRGGGETHLTTLRRGRAALVAFLVAIDAPGQEDAVVRLLAPSPVPSYLGYLSPSEDYRTSRRRGKEQVIHRSSYFLPAVEEGGDTTLPPPPMVTEVGLSMCVRNFLHGDVPPAGGGVAQTSSRRGAVEIFRNRGPLRSSQADDARGNSLRSILTPLPDTNDLAYDLFDLSLRLAAGDDGEHEGRPLPLRLATPSPSESLTIILRVVSDHSDWLSPIAIAPRYRFVLQHIIRTPFVVQAGIISHRCNKDCQPRTDGPFRYAIHDVALFAKK